MTGRKLVEGGGANVVVVDDGLGNEKGALAAAVVVVAAAVVDGVEKEKAGVAVVETLVAGVDNENDGRV